MEHIEANVKIYFTRDYSMFNSVKGNRLLNEKKIDRIIEEIHGGFDMLRYCPIIVDKDLCVIDGQHRLQVARMIKSNIWYMIADSISLYEMARLNTNIDKWKQKDFIHAYTILKNEHYMALEEFSSKYKISSAVAINLLGAGTSTPSGTFTRSSIADFEAGKFEVKYLERATQIMDLVIQFKDFKQYKNKNFIAAIMILEFKKKCDMMELIEKYKKKPEALEHQLNAKAYLKNLEEIYNRHAQTRKIIY